MFDPSKLTDKFKQALVRGRHLGAKAKMPALLILLLSVNSAYSYSNEAITPLSPEFKLDGLSAVDWSAEWWKWAMANQGDSNPVRDNTGIYCGAGQQGKVWFLAGGFGSSKIKRNCTIPADKYVFFPIINMSYWPPVRNTNLTCSKAIEAAALNNDTALDLIVELDGVQVKNPKAFRARTEKCFDIFEKTSRAFASYYNAYPSATDGYWIFLKPLPKGKHSFKFGGRYNKTDGDAYGKMVQDIEYDITVQ